MSTEGGAPPAGPPGSTDGPPPAGTGPEGVPEAGTKPGTDPTTEATTGPVRIVGVGRGDRPGVGWTEIAIAAAAYLALQVVLGLVALFAGGGRLPASPWLIAISAASAFGAVAVAMSVRVRSLAALGLRRVRPRTAALGAGVGLLVWVVSRLLILGYVVVTGDRSDPQADLAVFTGPVSIVLVIVLGALVVPAGEELLFRGIGYGGLRRYGVVLPAILSALVFATAHGLNVVFAAALLLGLVNAALYERTRSVWPCIAAHATFNLLSFVLAIVLR